MKYIKGFASFLGFIAIVLLCGCNKDAVSGSVSLNLDHSVAGEDLQIETKAYLSPVGHPFFIHRLKYYISDIKIHQSTGGEISFDNIHYFDLDDQESGQLKLGDLPAGDYNGLSFVYGLNEAININGGLPNTQTNVNMEWPIPGDQGYHYMKFEGKYDLNGTGEIKNFNLHTGATKGNQNFIEISMSINSISIDGNDITIMLEMDLLEWLQNPTIYDFEEFGPMIMMNQNAQDILKQNGQSVFKVTDVISN